MIFVDSGPFALPHVSAGAGTPTTRQRCRLHAARSGLNLISSPSRNEGPNFVGLHAAHAQVAGVTIMQEAQAHPRFFKEGVLGHSRHAAGCIDGHTFYKSTNCGRTLIRGMEFTRKIMQYKSTKGKYNLPKRIY